MPPKVRITREDIIGAAVGLLRTGGGEVLNARNLAAALGCSTQPVFSNFATMDELRLAVVQRADCLFQSYIQREIETGEYPAYKASGMAYIRFAKEEKELFKLLYMCDCRTEQEIEDNAAAQQMEKLVQTNTGLKGADNKLFHLEMWTCVHGIAVMFATSFLDLDWELVSSMLTDVYQGLRKRHTMEE